MSLQLIIDWLAAGGPRYLYVVSCAEKGKSGNVVCDNLNYWTIDILPVYFFVFFFFFCYFFLKFWSKWREVIYSFGSSKDDNGRVKL